jgi:3-hydroxyacyl-CoA dehydrogenase
MITAVSVIGLGKLGAPMAACFAASGFTVQAVDLNECLRLGDGRARELRYESRFAKDPHHSWSHCLSQVEVSALSLERLSHLNSCSARKRSLEISRSTPGSLDTQ